MKIIQKKWSPDQGWEPFLSKNGEISPNLILLFGSGFISLPFIAQLVPDYIK